MPPPVCVGLKTALVEAFYGIDSGSGSKPHALLRDGTAILTGIVDSWSGLAAATVSAWAGGTMRVINDLELAGDR